MDELPENKDEWIAEQRAKFTQGPPISDETIIRADLEQQALILKAKIFKLGEEKKLLENQVKFLSDREIELRVRSEVSEELVDKFFEKILHRMN